MVWPAAGWYGDPNESVIGKQIVARMHSPEYLILSFIVSYIGSWTTLELINKRTYLRGWYNWFLLVAASISMGGCAIWCTHVIGSRAIILGDGDSRVQISSSAGYMVLSFFVSIIVLFVAFVTMGIDEEIDYVRLALGGALAGLEICGVHYLGQASITNYICIYDIPNVVGAAIVAIVASTTALGIFFVFRSAWSTTLWKRGICAMILSSAVTGMFWVASIGTAYRFKAGSSPSTGASRNAIAIVATVISIGNGYVLLLLTLITYARKRRAANRAQEVVLAATIFDRDGRVLVTAEGVLPNVKITGSYRELSMNDTFNNAHPTFIWIYQTTRNWGGVQDLISPMKDHLHRTGIKNRFGAESDIKFLTEQGTPIKDYHLVFRELFCTAAADLADDLNQPLEKLGVMYDHILQTGLQPKQYQAGRRYRSRAKHHRSRQEPMDLERDGLELETIGKGQLLFLVREVNKQEVECFQATGYRFASPQSVIPIVAGTFQITQKELEGHLDIMRENAGDDHILDPGVHLALFAVKASMGSGFEVISRRDAKNQLPTMLLPLNRLERWQLEYLRRLEDCTVIACLRHLRKFSKTDAGLSELRTPKEKLFASQLLLSLETLRNEIDDPVFDDACIVAKPVYAPCRGSTESSRPGNATLVIFRLVVPVGTRAPGKKLDFTPLSLFRAQQHVFKNSPDHAVLARNTYREFTHIINVSERPSIVEIIEMPHGRRQNKFVGGVSRMDAEEGYSGDLGRHAAQDLEDSKQPSQTDQIVIRHETQLKHKLSHDNWKRMVDRIKTEDEFLGVGVCSSVDTTKLSFDTIVDDNAPTRKMTGKRRDAFESSGSETKGNKVTILDFISGDTQEEGGKVSYVDECFDICMRWRGNSRVINSV